MIISYVQYIATKTGLKEAFIKNSHLRLANIEGEITFYTEGDSFDHLTPKDFLKKHFSGKAVHSFRKNEFLASRLSLKKLLSLSHPSVTLNDLELNEFYQLKNFPEFISISHTKYVAVATISSIPHGVDIESQNRQISPAVEKLITHPQDDLTLSALKRWNAKEAAFKMLFSQKIKVQKFSEIQISIDAFSFASYQGELKYVETTHDEQKFSICIAF